MFQENHDPRQESFFSLRGVLSEKLWEQLWNSWAGTFYREVFCRIDEKILAVLYSEKDSRPNAPINVLKGLEILKSGFGWSDEQLEKLALETGWQRTPALRAGACVDSTQVLSNLARMTCLEPWSGSSTDGGGVAGGAPAIG
jgi:hypothetical protein